MNHTAARGDPLVQGRVEINILLAPELRESFIEWGPVRLEILLLTAGAEPDEERIAYEIRRRKRLSLGVEAFEYLLWGIPGLKLNRDDG